MFNAKKFYRVSLAVFLGACAAFFSVLIIASPQGGTVQAGNITISNTSPGITTITQTTQKGIINWKSFSIGAAESIYFSQPGIYAITLNRVIGGNISYILGQLSATGQVWILNPAGVIFGPKAQVDVAGLLATTAGISNADFMAGNYNFFQGANGNARIINRGYINAANNGLVFLIAPRVENIGIIKANLGVVVLGSVPAGASYVLDFYGDRLVQFVLPPELESQVYLGITQRGKIIANGGEVLLTAATARSVVDKVINMSGIIEANTVSGKQGSVILSGGEQGVVSVTGKIIARGNKPGETGGTVKIEGENVGLFDNATVDVSGMAGGGNVLIGADYVGVGGALVPTATATYVGPGVNILADAIKYGIGGMMKNLVAGCYTLLRYSKCYWGS